MWSFRKEVSLEQERRDALGTPGVERGQGENWQRLAHWWAKNPEKGPGSRGKEGAAVQLVRYW